jgi:hypothetical protein
MTYNTREVRNAVTARYAGAGGFGNRTGRRELSLTAAPAADTPGPGAYVVAKPLTSPSPRNRKSPSFCNTARRDAACTLDELASARVVAVSPTPAPNAYTLPTTLSPPPPPLSPLPGFPRNSAFCFEEDEIAAAAAAGRGGHANVDDDENEDEDDERPRTSPAAPFLSTAPRFPPLRETAPPVGLYEDPRRCLRYATPTPADARRPFTTATARFPSPHTIRLTPGPAAYDVRASGVRSPQSTAEPLAGRIGHGDPFAASADAADMPGPDAYYAPGSMASMTAAAQGRAPGGAGSTSARDVPPPNAAVPPPTRYSAGQSSDAVYRHGQRTLAAVPFNVAQPRFVTADLPPLPAQDAPPANKYPGARVAALTAHGGLITDPSVPRFRTPTPEAPPPNAYSFAPGHQHSVYVPTFNASLRDPVGELFRTAVRAENATARRPATAPGVTMT